MTTEKSRVAIFVEDQLDFALPIVGVLEDLGFRVRLYEDCESVVAGLEAGEINAEAELFVLDRAIPTTSGSEPSTDAGDALFEQLYRKFVDSAFIQFSGFADYEQLQHAIDPARTIVLHGQAGSIQAACGFKKGQTLEFSNFVERIAGALNEVDDVDLQLDADLSVPDHHKRLLRKLALEFRGASVKYVAFGAGASDASVGLATVVDETGSVVARYVAKSVALPYRTSAGGLASLIGATHAASASGLVSGFGAGIGLALYNFAGEEVQPLMQLIADDPSSAAGVTRALRHIVDAAVISLPRVLALRQVIGSLISWDELVAVAQREGVTLPSSTKQISVRSGPAHGDLHAHNVLVVNHQPVLIDFESQVAASAALDPAGHLIGTLLHKKSTLRDYRLTGSELLAQITGVDASGNEWLAAAIQWLDTSASSRGELWAVALGTLGRFLRYDDVRNHPASYERASTVFAAAAEQLRNS